MQRLNDAIPSDRRATLISVDSMAYSLLMIPASPLVGLVGDLTGQAGAGSWCYCAHLSSSAALRQRAKRAIMGAEHNYPIFVGADARIGSQHRRQNPDDI